MNLKREGFDCTNPLEPTILRSYFIDYSPSAKAYKTEGGEDKLFQEVAKFLLEVAFVSPRFYCMPKQRAAFIIATYEGDTIDWGYLNGEAPWNQMKRVQNNKPMKPIFGRWLMVLYPTASTEIRHNTPRKERGQPKSTSRAQREVPHEEWQEPEQTTVDTQGLEPTRQSVVEPQLEAKPQQEQEPIPSPDTPVMEPILTPNHQSQLVSEWIT